MQAAIDKVGIGALGAAVFDGDVEHGSVMSGQIAGMVRKEQPAAEMIKEMFEEAKMIYSDRASLF